MKNLSSTKGIIAVLLSITLFSCSKIDQPVIDKKSILSESNSVTLEGRYELSGAHNRVSLSDPYKEEVQMISTGENSVKMFWPELDVETHPLHGGLTYYAGFTTEFNFDKETNALISVSNPLNKDAHKFTIVPESNSRFDKSSNTIYAQYYFNDNTERMFSDTLVLIGSR